MIFIVIVVMPELRVTELFVETYGGCVAGGDLKSQVERTGAAHLNFCLQQQLTRYPPALTVRRDRERVQASKPGALSQYDQAIPGQARRIPGDEKHAVGASQPAFETAPRKTVGTEAVVFNLQQGVEIVRARRFNLQRGLASGAGLDRWGHIR